MCCFYRSHFGIAMVACLQVVRPRPSSVRHGVAAPAGRDWRQPSPIVSESARVQHSRVGVAPASKRSYNPSSRLLCAGHGTPMLVRRVRSAARVRGPLVDPDEQLAADVRDALAHFLEPSEWGPASLRDDRLLRRGLGDRSAMMGHSRGALRGGSWRAGLVLRFVDLRFACIARCPPTWEAEEV